jgi:hypothetical protein
MQYKFEIAINKKNTSVNKLTTYILIALNSKLLKPTYLTILKCLKYPWLRIYSVDDIKVIDLIYIRSTLIFQPETNKHRTKTELQNTPHKDG